MRLVRYYLAEMRNAILHEFQYRTAAFLLLVGFLIEPIVYLVVWRTVAEAQGGAIGGYTADAFTAYYIVWTLVRAMNLALTPYVWEWRIREGRLSDLLLRPVHPFHRDFAFFAGSKFVWIIMWIPIAALLYVTFQPDVTPTAIQWIGFAIAIWGGFAVRHMILFLMGLLNFWTTRASAFFETIIAAELLLSGRLVPLTLMPAWVQSLADWLPFQWTFQFPIEVLIGRLDTAEIVSGLGMQVVWSVVLGTGIALGWKRATRRYTAVGA